MCAQPRKHSGLSRSSTKRNCAGGGTHREVYVSPRELDGWEAAVFLFVKKRLDGPLAVRLNPCALVNFTLIFSQIGWPEFPSGQRDADLVREHSVYLLDPIICAGAIAVA